MADITTLYVTYLYIVAYEVHTFTYGPASLEEEVIAFTAAAVHGLVEFLCRFIDTLICNPKSMETDNARQALRLLVGAAIPLRGELDTFTVQRNGSAEDLRFTFW